GRITGLTLIAVLTLGLGYLHFAGSSTAVSVPAGAHAGQLTLKNCTYNTEKGAYAADCGTLVVPENRADPHSRLIALPIVRIRAQSTHPGAPIFRLEGGPGVTNMKFADASRFTANHDVVLVGYRGVDGSVRLNCPEVESALEHSADFLGQKSLDAYSNALRSCAKRLEANGVDLAGYTLPERVDDLEAARKALGYHQIDLLSESAGTRTAMIYSWRYPTAIHRSVMIGVNPPGNFIWYPKTTDEQIARYASLCAQDATCHKRTGDLAASLERTVAHMPNRWLFFPIKKGNARIASFFGLMETTENASPLSGPMTLDAWLSAAHGDSSGLWFESLLAQIAFPEAFVWGDVAAVGMADNQAAERYYSSSEHDGSSIIGNPGTEFLFGGGGLLHAWPATPADNEYTHVQTSNVQTLLIGGSLDFATPPQNATKELLPYLPNGHQVILAGFGHTTSFWSEQTKASTHLINTYFDTGKVDDSLYKPQTVKLTPESTQTGPAKAIAGAMIGLGLLMILSLLLMWRRKHKRGGFGRKASATLRSLY
ncbi:alpha/beta hydrolase, partial [Mycobacterium sp.]|uniref:alpha/beta hydrolase n=1 Tax=Mycobacterium sp. TaxID=1785 RepID=UPI003C794000